MGLANVGAAASSAMAAIALRSAAKPFTNAGTKCSISMRSNGGILKGVVQASSSGFWPGGRTFISSTLGFAAAAAARGRGLLGVLGFVRLLTMTGPVCSVLGLAG